MGYLVRDNLLRSVWIFNIFSSVGTHEKLVGSPLSWTYLMDG